MLLRSQKSLIAPLTKESPGSFVNKAMANIIPITLKMIFNGAGEAPNDLGIAGLSRDTETLYLGERQAGV